MSTADEPAARATKGNKHSARRGRNASGPCTRAQCARVSTARLTEKTRASCSCVAVPPLGTDPFGLPLALTPTLALAIVVLVLVAAVMIQVLTALLPDSGVCGSCPCLGAIPSPCPLSTYARKRATAAVTTPPTTTEVAAEVETEVVVETWLLCDGKHKAWLLRTESGVSNSGWGDWGLRVSWWQWRLLLPVVVAVV